MREVLFRTANPALSQSHSALCCIDELNAFKAQRSITHYAQQKQLIMLTSNRISYMRIMRVTFSLIFFRSCDPYIMTFEPSLPAGGKGPYTLTSYKSPQVRT
jgi:hypothetical protein